MRHTRKALAASFVVTFAPGCDTASPRPTTPTVDLGTSPPVPSASAAAAPGASDAPAAASAPGLPPAPAFGRVERAADGTCTWFAQVGPCPRVGGRIVPCNPPPPHQVQCPPGDGGT